MLGRLPSHSIRPGDSVPDFDRGLVSRWDRNELRIGSVLLGAAYFHLPVAQLGKPAQGLRVAGVNVGVCLVDDIRGLIPERIFWKLALAHSTNSPLDRILTLCARPAQASRVSRAVSSSVSKATANADSLRATLSLKGASAP
jgi:hypothetical protein